MYYVKRTEPQLWTVGINGSDGWEPFEDFSSRAEAIACADMRNGIRPVSSSSDTAASLSSIAASLAGINESLQAVAAWVNFTGTGR